MKLKVSQRIGIAMVTVVVANLLTAGVSAVYFIRAAEYQQALSAAAAHERLAADAVEHLTAYEVEAEAYVVAVRSNRVADQSDEYGRLTRADQAAAGALRSLAQASPPSDAGQVLQGWQELRLGTLTWLNAEAASDSAPARLWLAPNGSLNTNSTSNVPSPAYLNGLSAADMRPAVRTRFDGLRDGTIASIRSDASTAADAANAANQSARDSARNTTLGLALLSFLVAAIAGIWVYRGTVPPLETARRFADRVAGGDLDATFPRHRDDEIGHLTTAIENMKDAVVRDLRAMQEMAGAVLFTAEAVSDSARRALATHDSRDDSADHADRIAGRLKEVAANADALTGLAHQMLET